MLLFSSSILRVNNFSHRIRTGPNYIIYFFFRGEGLSRVANFERTTVFFQKYFLYCNNYYSIDLCLSLK